MSARPARSQVWDLIEGMRDAAPRDVEDAPTDDIIDALVDAGYIQLAGGE